MEFKDFSVQKDDEDRRLDRILKLILSGKNQAELNSLIRKNLIRVNKKKTQASYHLLPGDQINIARFLLNELEAQPVSHKKLVPPCQIPVIFENEFIKIINKPYDTLCQPSKDSDFDLSSYMQEEFESKHQNTSLSFKTGALHRLDRYTTGLLAFSMNSTGARYFSEGIQKHSIKKSYLGIAEGKFSSTDWTQWQDSLEHTQDTANQESDFHRMNVAQKDSQQAEKAITLARAISWGKFKGKDITLIEYKILTGKKHQIRLQSSHHGHPLLGDSAYGSKIQCPFAYLLHAYQLEFEEDNPIQVPAVLKAPLSDKFSQFVKINLINPPKEIII